MADPKYTSADDIVRWMAVVKVIGAQRDYVLLGFAAISLPRLPVMTFIERTPIPLVPWDDKPSDTCTLQTNTFKTGVMVKRNGLHERVIIAEGAQTDHEFLKRALPRFWWPGHIFDSHEHEAWEAGLTTARNLMETHHAG